MTGMPSTIPGVAVVGADVIGADVVVGAGVVVGADVAGIDVVVGSDLAGVDEVVGMTLYELLLLVGNCMLSQKGRPSVSLTHSRHFCMRCHERSALQRASQLPSQRRVPSRH